RVVRHAAQGPRAGLGVDRRRSHRRRGRGFDCTRTTWIGGGGFVLGGQESYRYPLRELPRGEAELPGNRRSAEGGQARYAAARARPGAADPYAGGAVESDAARKPDRGYGGRAGAARPLVSWRGKP